MLYCGLWFITLATGEAVDRTDLHDTAHLVRRLGPRVHKQDVSHAGASKQVQFDHPQRPVRPLASLTCAIGREAFLASTAPVLPPGDVDRTTTKDDATDHASPRTP